MDSSEYLRLLARLDSRAVRAERAQTKLEQELSASRAAEKQATEEVGHVSRLADIFFELSQILGGVVDHWLKERGTKEPGQEPESTKIFRRAQKLTRELQHVLEDDPSKYTITDSLPQTQSAARLEAAFEWDRIRRSAAPSPELISKEFQKQKMQPDSSELAEGY
ncbi:uncharacterized protein PGRI_096150 [Penicillium griseofulvum]|uniref:Uncharacterized protein n=1 Tax=Penicillium patulum TaxID=5078 RepID=A0A135M0J6_PENPA|nr:uncharacterized protein PGRI_096150 [Penicillium griseofulvum]KXG54740.1 hypothetical protein PGRI_096150 [Penicillium griseofulvum]